MMRPELGFGHLQTVVLQLDVNARTIIRPRAARSTAQS